jgi:L-ribulose-5-phosphate 3-epimerase
MPALSRRKFLARAAVGALASATIRLDAREADLRIGVTDWNLKHEAQPDSIEFAQRLGFDGVQISLGRAKDHLPLGDVARQEEFITESRKHQFPIASTCLDILHQNYLKNDPLGKRWVTECIPITKKLGAHVILLPFFGDGALKTRDEMAYVADFLKEVAPEADKAGVVLGLENTISAEDNARILDRAGSSAVRVYYDVGNSHRNGFDIYKEIRWLGKERICEFHLKDNPHLMGQGSIDFGRVVKAIRETEFKGWAVLETDCPSKSVEKDMRTNLAFLRNLLAEQ